MSLFLGLDVYTCPYCGRKSSDYHQASGNTIGARFYSDTYCYAPMGGCPMRVAKCQKCGKYSLLSRMNPKTVFPCELCRATERMDEEDGDFHSESDEDEFDSELCRCYGFSDLSKAVRQFEAEGLFAGSVLGKRRTRAQKDEIAARTCLLWASTPWVEPLKGMKKIFGVAKDSWDFDLDSDQMPDFTGFADGQAHAFGNPERNWGLWGSYLRKYGIPSRMGLDVERPKASVVTENRRKLLELLPPNSYLRAELHRELGEFKEAADVLANVRKNDGWHGAVAELSKAIEARDPNVFELAIGRYSKRE